MKLFGRDIEGFAQWLVFFVTVLLIAGGLCGLQLAVFSGSRGGSGGWEGIFMLTGYLELAAMVISTCGVLVILILWPISRLYDAFAPTQKDHVQHLFNDSQNQHNDDNQQDS